ncbi:MAG: metabolite traffic protein EboE [Planctomycetia bacterium]|nr:metabolite traffic protein EboE [Planctomycetia bacterium]
MVGPSQPRVRPPTCNVGYCTNVHAGADWSQTRANLERYAVEVKRRFSPNAPMGIGLWLSSSAARGLLGEGSVEGLRDWLAGQGLVPYTLNGFPYGDFHQPVVKHAVYLPKWGERERLRYTLDLIAIQDLVLPEDLSGTISTLPIAWGEPPPSREDRAAAAQALRTVARRLAELELSVGRHMELCIEPEPGCTIQRSDDLVRFYEDDLLGRDAGPLTKGEEAQVRRHIGVCHDVCHAVVMFEEQAEVLRRYHAAGIRVGKIQISSAVCANLNGLGPAERKAAIDQLASFRETRYLHQTCVREKPGEMPRFYQDLPEAIQAAGDELRGQWRTHFHVPVYLKRFGRLEASQGAILDCLSAAARYFPEAHYEVETYAWNVLPAELKEPDLAAGIAKELKWFAERF